MRIFPTKVMLPSCHPRHGRACHGHARLALAKKDVDARNECRHDDDSASTLLKLREQFSVSLSLL